MADQRKFMPVKEFRELGYLQELNRRFLHPLGLALEVKIDPLTTQEVFGRVWDSRDDPEGIIFEPNLIRNDVALAIFDDEAKRKQTRFEQLGFEIQPLT